MPIQREVLGVRTVAREDEALRVDAANLRLAPQIADGRIIVGARQQPEHRIRHGRENRRPRVEHLRIELVRLVEAAEHRAGLRQSKRAARGRLADRPLAVVDLIGVRQHGDRLRVVGHVLDRRHDGVADQVVDERGAERPRVTQIVDLDRRRPPRQHDRRRVLRVALEIDENVDGVARG